MDRIAVQLYTLRSLDEPLPTILDRVGDAGYDGVEFAYRVREASPEAVRDALDRNGLASAAAHVTIEALESEYDAVVDRYDRLDCHTLVVPWMDPDRFETIDRIDAVADRLNALVEAFDDDGFTLAYHHHDHEFVAVEGGRSTAMDELLGRTDDRLGFELDLGWAAVGGADPAALLDRYADRISHVHVSDADVDAGEPVALGAGDLDVPRLIDAGRRADVDWWVYEHDDPDDPIASMTDGIEVLRRHVG